MTFEGQQCVVANHAAAVVGDLDQFLAARLHLNANSPGAGVERVFKKLFDDRGGTLHHLAGGDLVSNGFGKDVDAAHGVVGRQSSVVGENMLPRPVLASLASLSDDNCAGKAWSGKLERIA